jgi:uncharacterized protein YndB with AHSA1/START domain
MPQIKHEAGRRSIELEFEVPGTPEQVWHAIATGPGITSWFTRSDVEQRVGGAIAFHMGEGMDSAGTVTAWEPPTRFAYEEPNWSPPAPPLATEFLIEARSGGTCVVRLVHSLFASSADWDDQMEDFEKGWASMFNVLRLYLAHFFGQPSANVRVMSPSPGPEKHAWDTLASAIGLAGATTGERRTISGGSGTSLAGTVERIREADYPHEALIRLDQPAPGIVLVGAYAVGGTTHTMMTLFLYGERAATIAPGVEASLRGWLDSAYVAPGR